MADRVPVPDKLAAEVLFASDRTCCVCRLERHKVQIHHIDGDSSNNAFENLAVICLHCHSDAHTTGAFVRNLTPDLIRLYNSSWRGIVQMRLTPSTPETQHNELAAEGFLQASLDCHRWKVTFMTIAGSGLPDGSSSKYGDVWDVIAELWIPKYSPEIYDRFVPLFDNGLRDVQRRFDRLPQLFGDVLPGGFRATLVRATRQLEAEQAVYLSIPGLFDASLSSDVLAPFFYARFVGVIGVLRNVARESDRLREIVTTTPTDGPGQVSAV